MKRLVIYIGAMIMLTAIMTFASNANAEHHNPKTSPKEMTREKASVSEIKDKETTKKESKAHKAAKKSKTKAKKEVQPELPK